MKKTPLEEFNEVKNITIDLTPFTPTLRLYPRHFLEMESLSRSYDLHCGGIRLTITMKGFASRRYMTVVKDLLEEHRAPLGVSPVGITKRKITERGDEYYLQEFRGETAVTQVAAAE